MECYLWWSHVTKWKPQKWTRGCHWNALATGRCLRKHTSLCHLRQLNVDIALWLFLSLLPSLTGCSLYCTQKCQRGSGCHPILQKWAFSISWLPQYDRSEGSCRFQGRPGFPPIHFSQYDRARGQRKSLSHLSLRTSKTYFNEPRMCDLSLEMVTHQLDSDSSYWI